MRTAIRTGLILPGLLIAVSACGSASSSSDALVGDWTGKCSTTKDQSGEKAADDVDAKLQFTKDGKYTQTFTGPDGGKVSGNYTVAGETITISAEGDSVNSTYAIKDGVLTVKTPGKTTDTPVTTTCNLRQG